MRRNFLRSILEVQELKEMQRMNSTRSISLFKQNMLTFGDCIAILAGTEYEIRGGKVTRVGNAVIQVPMQLKRELFNSVPLVDIKLEPKSLFDSLPAPPAWFRNMQKGVGDYPPAMVTASKVTVALSLKSIPDELTVKSVIWLEAYYRLIAAGVAGWRDGKPCQVGTITSNHLADAVTVFGNTSL